MPPPPLAPVIIPQNTNPIPTAISSPMSGSVMSPTSAGGYVRRAAPEPNKRALYVGGLDPRITEDVLRQIFETAGHVVSVKIIPDKNVRRPLFSSALSARGRVAYGDLRHPSFAASIDIWWSTALCEIAAPHRRAGPRVRCDDAVSLDSPRLPHSAPFCVREYPLTRLMCVEISVQGP